MLKGVHLTLMVGPLVPVPVPQEVLDALTGVQVVTNAVDAASGFELTFTLSTASPLHMIFLVAGGLSIPLVRVIIAVTINGTTDVLMDGVMTHHEVKPGTDAGHATLTVKGKDLTAVMDYIEFTTPYPAMPGEARVALMVAKYVMFGIIPMIVPSVLLDVPIPLEKIPGQRGDDIRVRARRPGADSLAKLSAPRIAQRAL